MGRTGHMGGFRRQGFGDVGGYGFYPGFYGPGYGGYGYGYPYYGAYGIG